MTSLKDRDLRVEIWHWLNNSYNEIAQGEMLPGEIKQMLSDDVTQIITLFQQEVMAALPEKKICGDWNYTEKFGDAVKSGYNQALSDMESRLKERLELAQPESGGDE